MEVEINPLILSLPTQEGVIEELGIIILAGGKSSRMGEDKGLKNLNGKPMVSHVIDTAHKISDNIILIANNRDYLMFGIPVYDDLYKETGPLGGIYTGLHYSRFEKNLVLSCDIPFVNTELLEFIIASSSDYDITVPVHNGRSHQLIGIYQKSCLKVFQKQLYNGNYKIRDAFDLLNVQKLNCDEFDKRYFRNINSPDDLKF